MRKKEIMELREVKQKMHIKVKGVNLEYKSSYEIQSRPST